MWTIPASPATDSGGGGGGCNRLRVADNPNLRSQSQSIIVKFLVGLPVTNSVSTPLFGVDADLELAILVGNKTEPFKGTPIVMYT